MDVIEEEPEKESDSDSDRRDSEDDEDYKITDSKEQEPVQANISAPDTLIARGISRTQSSLTHRQPCQGSSMTAPAQARP